MRSISFIPTPATAAAPSSGAGKCSIRAAAPTASSCVRDTLTGEADYYLVSHSTPGTEERTSTLYDADGSAVMAFPHAVNATLSGRLLILRDDADVWAFESGATGGIRVYRPRHRGRAARAGNGS